MCLFSALLRVDVEFEQNRSEHVRNFEANLIRKVNNFDPIHEAATWTILAELGSRFYFAMSLHSISFFFGCESDEAINNFNQFLETGKLKSLIEDIIKSLEPTEGRISIKKIRRKVCHKNYCPSMYIYDLISKYVNPRLQL